MVPYDDFAEKEKELVGIINEAITNIDSQVKGYEEGLRQEKLVKVKEIYKENISDLDRTVPFEKIFKDSWLNVSTTLKSVKEEITAIHDKVDGDLKIINAENSPYVYEMKEEYLKDFDLMAAMAKKQQLEETAQKKAIYEEQKRKEAEERERQRKEEAERVEMAGKVQKIQKLPDPENEPVDIVPQEAIQEQKPLKRKRVTIAITANETQYAYLNEVLTKLENNAEKVDILKKEEF